ncbi:MAG: hypothetical protein HY260_15165, partial [Chloroflexi bacterium]|nr:hypothetical protein [Chloroflexota bacterium]
LGMAWFPWCFASFWWAVRRRDRASLALAAICVAMVLTAGGGYYPFYLLVSLSALMIVALLSSHRADRWPKAQRAIAVAALGVGLAAVTLLPLADGYRYTVRDAGQDLDQRFSQPIRYALINYVVSQPAWFNTEILGSAGGWNWFYIGFLPVLAALSLTPLALSRRHRRPALIGVAVLALVILAWHASKFAPVKYIYDWVPFLYTFRFPNRLLVLATSPLIVLGGIGLQSLLLDLRRWGRGFVAVVSRKDGGPAITGVSIKHILDVALIVVLVLTLRDVYSINKVFAFAPRPRNPKPNTALTWLKNYDPDLYYTNIGGGTIYWDWTPAAYEMEMPIINFEYGRHVATSDQQHGEGSPFVATPKYMLALPDQPRPENAEMIHDFDGVGLWYLPDALPFAFSAAPAELQPYASLNRQDASALKARLDGPNSVVVTGAPGTAGDQLVVLVSDYAGWRLLVDGRPAEITSANYYLGAVMPPGEHTYTFVFSPTSHYAGLGISLLSLLIALGLMWADSSFRLARSRLEAAIAQSPSASSAD